MNKKSGSGSGPFLMEMLVVVGFFIICASICVMVFAKADNISRNARDINQAVLKAESLVETMKAGKEPSWSETAPDQELMASLPQGEGTDRFIYWDRSWNELTDGTGMSEEPSADSSKAPSGKDAPVPEYAAVVRTETTDSMRRDTVYILRYGTSSEKGKLLFELPVMVYEKP